MLKLPESVTKAVAWMSDPVVFLDVEIRASTVDLLFVAAGVFTLFWLF